MAEIYGYGICIDAIMRVNDRRWFIKERGDFEPLKKLLNLAPNFANDHVLVTLSEIEIETMAVIDRDSFHLAYLASELMYRVFGDDAGSTGISYIMSLVLQECEGINTVATIDENCNEYLIFKARFPWEMNNREKTLSEEEIKQIIGKYVRVLTGEMVEPELMVICCD